MCRYDHLAGSWSALTARLDAAETMRTWARREPRLSGVAGVADLVCLTGQAAPAAGRDAVLGAVVRLAAVSGGNDPDAALVVLHLLTPGALRLAVRLAAPLLSRHADVAVQMTDLVVGELMVQIRSFPAVRRTRAYAANLLWDTRAGVLREVAALTGPEQPAQDWLIQAHAERPTPGAEDNADLDVLDVLRWAHRTGVSCAEDLRLVLDLERSAQDGPGARIRVAAAHGVTERTIRRRRDRTLAQLRGARQEYLRGVA